MNRKIVLITDAYPYSTGEKTFLVPELEVISKDNDVTIISCGSGETNNDEEFLSRMGVEVLHYTKDTSFLCILRRIIITIIKRVFWDELYRIFRLKTQLFTRTKAAFWFVYEAVCFQDWLEKIIDLESVDLFYTYWYYAHTLSLVFLKGKCPSIRILSRAHGYDIHDNEAKGGRQCFKKYMDSRIDAISFISNEGLSYYLKHNSIQQKQIHSVHYLGAPKAVSEVNIVDNRKKEFLIVSCSGINKYKRLHLLIDALSLVDNYKLRWVHFGDGILSDQVKEYAKGKLGEKNNVSFEFKGSVERKEIYRFYHDEPVSCYVLVSYSEGLPVSNMEALANALPIITTLSGATDETINDNGILLSENPNPGEIKEAIDHIRYLPESDYLNMKRESLKLWEKSFDVEKNMLDFSDYLRNL